MNRKKGSDNRKVEVEVEEVEVEVEYTSADGGRDEEASGNVVSPWASDSNTKTPARGDHNSNQSSTKALLHPCRQYQYQQYQYPQPQTQPQPQHQTPTQPRSWGKSLVPTNISPKKRRRKPLQTQTSPPQQLPDPSNGPGGTSPAASTKRRRRCLPKSNPTTGGSGGSSSGSSSEPVATTTTASPRAPTTTRQENKILFKMNFPGKIFQLVESCSSSSSSSSSSTNHLYRKQRQGQRQGQHSGEILSWLPSISDHNTSCRKANAAAAAALLEDSTTNKQQQQNISKFSLVIWDKDQFMASNLVKDSSLASLSFFRSFERQLNTWGFKRNHCLEEQLLKHHLKRQTSSYNDNNNNNNNNTMRILSQETLRVFHHPLFQKGRPDLLEWIKRRQPGKGNKGIRETIKKKVVVASKDPPAVATEMATLTDANGNGNTSDSDSEDGRDNSTSRLDLVLPSGVCLRINQRIPAWAIPAQEAAVKYLFQKHNNSNNNNNNSETGTRNTIQPAAVSAVSNIASESGAHSNSKERGAPAPAKCLCSRIVYDCDTDSDIDIDSGISSGSCSERNSNTDSNADCNADSNADSKSSPCKESLVSKSETPNRTVVRMGDEDDYRPASPQCLSGLVCEENAEHRLGSLLQSPRKREVMPGNRFVFQTNTSNKNNNNNNGGDGNNDQFCDANEDGDRFCDANEDRYYQDDDDDEEWLVI